MARGCPSPAPAPASRGGGLDGGARRVYRRCRGGAIRIRGEYGLSRARAIGMTSGAPHQQGRRP
eukprot:1979654-Alexandrium_andersonii.AAC.1